MIIRVTRYRPFLTTLVSHNNTVVESLICYRGGVITVINRAAGQGLGGDQKDVTINDV